MVYTYKSSDEEAVIARLAPHFTPFAEPADASVPLESDPVWALLRPDIQLMVARVLQLELEEDGNNSTRVILREWSAFGAATAEMKPPAPEEEKLLRALVAHGTVPPSLEVVIRDLLLSTKIDASPLNADRVIDGYRAVAKGPEDSLYVALAILRANTIARSRSMPVEAAIRADMLSLAERTLSMVILPGISLRHAGAVAQPPRTGMRSVDEVGRLVAILDRIEADNRDESTIDWAAKCRLQIAETDAGKELAQRRHVERFLDLSEHAKDPFRAMLWAEKADTLASNYGIVDLHDKAVVRMQQLSRTDLGWERHIQEIKIPSVVFRQRAREIAKFSSWEQSLAQFLSTPSPSGDDAANRVRAAGMKAGILEIVSGRTFGSHQLPVRTHGSAESERLARIVRFNIVGAAMTLRVDLAAIIDRFGVPGESEIVTFLSAIFGSAPKLVRPYAQALRMHWNGDSSGAVRLAIPLVEAGSRELLFLSDEPLYRRERGLSPGRFPAMDTYVEKLEEIGFDPDWATAIRGILLSTGMNLRNKLAHGFQLDFTEDESALVLRLAGLFVAMPVGTGAIDDERARTPLALPRRQVRRRLGWVWR